MPDHPVFSDRECDLIRASIALILPDSDRFARRIYGRLFEVAPEVRTMFSSDPEVVRQNFMATLLTLGNAVCNPASLNRRLEQLSRHHREYGVVPEHYAVLRGVLAWTLDAELGAALDADTAAAWLRLYDYVAERMMRTGDTGA